MIETAAGGGSSVDEKLERSGKGDHPENLPLYNPGWENNFPFGWKYVRGSDGAIDGEVERNKDSPLYSHRLPLVVYLNITCPPEFHKFVFWWVILSTSSSRVRFPYSIVIFDPD